MDGDGLNEIVLATREPKLKILQLKNAASIEHMQAKAAAVAAAAVNAGDGSTSSAAATAAAAADAAEAALLGETLVVKHEVSLLAHSHKMRSGRQPAAIATGYLRPYSSHRSRKQIVVVVTDGFEILVYNHKLKLLWHRSMDADMRHSFLYEIAININSHSLRLNDTGSVVIGARQAFKADIAKYAIHKNWKKRGKKAHAKLHPQHSQQQTAHSDADKASNPDKPGGGSGHAKREGDDHSHGTHGGSHSKTEFPDLERDGTCSHVCTSMLTAMTHVLSCEQRSTMSIILKQNIISHFMHLKVGVDGCDGNMRHMISMKKPLHTRYSSLNTPFIVVSRIGDRFGMISYITFYLTDGGVGRIHDWI